MKKKTRKTNALQIALFVFLVITIVGLVSSLFGGVIKTTDLKDSVDTDNSTNDDQNQDGNNDNDLGIHEDLDMNCRCDHCDVELHSFVGYVCENCLSCKPHECSDSDADCICDFCEGEMHEFEGGYCLNCGSRFPHNCYDENGDSRCEICETILEHECEDNSDHICPICGSCVHYFGEGASCYYCDFVISHECQDSDYDCSCDSCGTEYHDPGAISEGYCMNCNKDLSAVVHEDNDEDFICDSCGGDMNDYLLDNETDHRDANDDGKCDYCNGSFCDGSV